MPQPNLSHLSVLAAVARHSSFRKAAEEVGISTSAVSHAVRGLEERLGVSLLNRTTRSVSLTDAGQRLVQRMQPALRDLGDALEEMNNFRTSPTGTLRINTSRSAAQFLIAPMIPRFLAAYPQLHVEIVDEDGLVDIVARGFDAGIRFEESIPEDMVGVRIGPGRGVAIVGSPDYFRHRAKPSHPDELALHECVRHRFPSGRIYKWELEKDGVKLDLDVKGRVTLGDQNLVVQMALEGIGLAYAFEDYVAGPVAQGRLVCVMEDWCPRLPSFMLYYPRQRKISSALRAFIDMAMEDREQMSAAA
ncbi:LysR family transcriptional regulator [Herbaspirillum sp. RV1423]|uniref:LysR family transcriptional regulator n=1 Tax=Herbaspirillum sp. RV1423 TaxID=1443993 RepID=UPI0004B3CD72|nr:LysR family transcriptional regulator [Herbaspirillum sp. RV1423]